MSHSRPSARRLLGALTALLLAGALLGPAALAAPTWVNPPVTLSEGGQDAADPQIVLDAAGNATAVWERYDGSRTRIQAASRAAGGTWTAATTLSEAGRDADSPQVAVDTAGNAVAVWRRYNGTHYVVQAATRPTGGAWTTPVDLSEAGQFAYEPQVAVDGDGNATAVWYRSDGVKDRIQAATRPTGGAWTTPADVSEAGLDADSPEVAVDRAGNATAIWRRHDGTHYRVQAATRPTGGTWTTPVTLSDAGKNAYHPEIALDPAGNAVAVWYRPDDANSRVQAATRTAAGAWGTPVTLSEVGMTAYDPQVDVDASGNAVVVWYLDDGTDYRVQAATRAAGGIWTNSISISEAGEDATEPRVAVDPAGNAVAVWNRYDGTSYRVQAATRPAGGPWTTPASLSQTGQDAEGAAVDLDPAGNAAAVWVGSDGTYDLIRAAGLDVVGPVITALSVPTTGVVGRPIALSVAAYDVWSALAGVTWSFGDGATASGATVQHTWTTPGTYTVTATLTDAVGNTTTKTASVAVTAAPPVATAPRITSFKLKPGTIEITGPKKKTRATATIVLTTDARVRIVFKKKGAKKSAATLGKSLKPGKNTFRLTTKIGKKRLTPGTYTLTARATNTVGTSKPVTVKLRVIR